ncbi:MAG: SDR family NAD(P)-dependent oxidoreductase [Desulfobacteraceae bacterium]
MAPCPAHCPIAVVGLACYYPDARNPLQLWENVLAKRRAFRRLPDQRLPLDQYYHADPKMPDKTYGRRAAVIDGFKFDWALRRIPQSTYRATDIVHWLALEIALEAMTDAGYSRKTVPGDRTGVIVGNTLAGEQTRSSTLRLRWPYVQRAVETVAARMGLRNGLLRQLVSRLEASYKSVFSTVNEDTLAGGLSNTIGGRICNYLNFNGGGYSIDGACASSLLAVSTAATQLARGDIDLALAGGVDISLDPFELVGFAKTGALTAKDMNVYDRRGSGFIPGEGCGFVVLQRLEDAKTRERYIYAVLQGWGISSDGGGTGITTPNPTGQARALNNAYRNCSFGPEALHFIEGHGTGTIVGDKAELSSIARALPPADGQRTCGITSLKSIIGHTKAASGIGGLLKAIIAVNRRVLPPLAGCRDPHPLFNDQARRLYPLLAGEVLPRDATLRAGVSAMGFGGINCHVAIESADPPAEHLTPRLKEHELLVSHQESEIFVLAGATPLELKSKVVGLRKLARGISIAELTDLASKLGRETDASLHWRGALIADDPRRLTTACNDLEQMLAKMNDHDPSMWGRHGNLNTSWLGHVKQTPRIGFLFPGQGSQQLNMAKRLIQRHQWARDMLKHTVAKIGNTDHPRLDQIIYRPSERASGQDEVEQWSNALAETQIAQPSICLASALWLRQLAQLGIKPDVVAGHSLGELTAFYAAGAYDFEMLIYFAQLRGKAMQADPGKQGAMVSLHCSQEKARQMLKQISDYLVIANINSPTQIIMSGESAAVESLMQLASAEGIPSRRLPVSNAFHSALAAPAADVIANDSHIPDTLPQLKCRLISSVNGDEIRNGVGVREHFAEQLRSHVNFIRTVETIAEGCDLMVEVGPGNVLTRLVSDILDKQGPTCLPVASQPDEDRDLNRVLANAWVQGADIAWPGLYKNRLIRPFTPATEKQFITNPCETAFETSGDQSPSIAGRSSDAITGVLGELSNLPDEELSAYLNTRGAFLAQVIRADLEHGGLALPTHPVRVADRPAAVMPPAEAKPPADQATAVDTQTLLYQTVHELTGFPLESLKPDLRLLDNLNLDSIKAADLLSRYAGACGITWPGNPAVLANATLAEIADAAKELYHRRSTAANVPPSSEKKTAAFSRSAIAGIIFELVQEITAFPRESLNLNLRMVDDLNLDSIKAGDLVSRAALSMGIKLELSSPPPQAATLADILDLLIQSSEESPAAAMVEATSPFTTQGFLDVNLHELLDDAEPWVRDFGVRLETASLPVLPPNGGQQQKDHWKTARVLLINCQSETNISDAMQAALIQKGARVVTAAVGTPPAMTGAADPFHTHLIAILPQKPLSTTTIKEQVLRAIEHRASILSPPQVSQASQERIIIAFLQFGGGFLGTRPPFYQWTQCSSVALAASLHHERKDLCVRVVDFSPTAEPEQIATAALAEIHSPQVFSAAAYDSKMTRRIPRPYLLDPGQYRPRSITWSRQDVLLVTGGGKGITAACAFRVAHTIGCRTALLGSSPYPVTTAGSNDNNPLTATLQRYTDHGLTAEYYCCDLTNQKAVAATLARIENEMGPVAAVIHGAGLNIPRPTQTVTPAEAYTEIAPKLCGAGHLFNVLAQTPPKLIVGLTSVIGITGMPGNAWYGFSNEGLEILLRRFAADHPETQTQAVAFSIWRDTGMGARMGSVEKLRAKGIEAIPTRAGETHFARLFMSDPQAHQVAVSARMSGLDTWRPQPIQALPGARFLNKLLSVTPGVEAVFQTHLTLEQDAYLQDHHFQGSYLFPTVFGLEAMAQTAAFLSGIWQPKKVVAEKIHLQRPITVDPKQGTTIVIRALVREDRTEETAQRINTEIYVVGSGFKGPSFSATLSLDETPGTLSHCIIDHPQKALALIPAHDLYRPTLLFQGPRFQRLGRIWKLVARAQGQSSAVFEASMEKAETNSAAAFNLDGEVSSHFILGDPFFNDALLHSAALMMPQDRSLPVYIQRWEFGLHHNLSSGKAKARVVLMGRTEQRFHTEIVAVDHEDRVLQRLSDYQLQILKHFDDYPTVSDLVDPAARDQILVKDQLSHAAAQAGMVLPQIALAYQPGIHKLSKAKRHHKEEPLLMHAAAQVLTPSNLTPTIRWQASGKPELVSGGDPTIALSLSHDERLCLATAGKKPQGCDIACITHRSRQQWSALLGEAANKLLDQLVEGSDSLDQAGTRIWAAREALFKTSQTDSNALTIVRQEERAVLFEHAAADQVIRILTLPLSLTWGPDRIVAVTVQPHTAPESATEAINSYNKAYAPLFGPKAFDIDTTGPCDQLVFVRRFPVTFKPSAQLSRRIYFSSYIEWMGESREASVWPVMDRLMAQISTGRWGSVTNFSEITILGEAATGDLLEQRMWTADNSGPENSTMTLNYDFRKLLPDGDYVRIAFCRIQTTWVELVGPGVARPAPYPDYFTRFMANMLPTKTDTPDQLDPLPEPLAGFGGATGEEPVYTAPPGPVIKPLLREQIFETALPQANVVGNVYYANYYEWQGSIRDRFFYELIPDHFSGIGEKGELLCLHSRVDHLREAMPFDRIVVTMALKALSASRASFAFEYYRLDQAGRRIKLATGSQDTAWIRRDKDGQPVAEPFPTVVHQAFEQAIADNPVLQPHGAGLRRLSVKR